MFTKVTPDTIREASQRLFGAPWGTPDKSKEPVTPDTIREARKTLFI